MTLSAVLRLAGLALAIVASITLAVILYDADAVVALFCLFMATFGLGLYCVGCLIPESTDDPTV